MHILLHFEKKLTEELIDTLENKVDEIITNSESVYDPDAMGYFDSAEHVTGLAFVTLQTYLTAVCGILKIEKTVAFSKGPKHKSGHTNVKIVNDAANYWKHNNEWSLDKNTKRRSLIQSTFQSIEIPLDTDYPLSNVMTELSLPNKDSFNAVLETIFEWQEDLGSEYSRKED